MRGPDRCGESSLQSGAFTQISAGGDHTCGLRPPGVANRWCLADRSQASPPTGAFSQLSAGGDHTCGLPSSGVVACWGENEFGQASQPRVSLIDVAIEGASLRTVACRLTDGRTEFGIEPDGGACILLRGRSFPASASVGRWLQSWPVLQDGIELGRIEARRLVDGRIEFGFNPSGAERILPRSRYFSATASPGHRLRSSMIDTPQTASVGANQATETRDFVWDVGAFRMTPHVA